MFLFVWLRHRLASRALSARVWMGGPFVGCRLKFSHFVGSRLKFSIFVGNKTLRSVHFGVVVVELIIVNAEE